MASTANKVKYGLKNVHYAKATFDDDGNVTYATPVRIPGAVNLSLDAEGEPEVFYADNIAYYVMNNNNGYTGDLEIALTPESFRTDILGETLDNNGVLVETADADVEHFALLFQFEGDKKAIRHVLYNCVCSRPSMESATTEDSKEVQTDTLSLTVTALANGYVKAKTGSETSDTIYDRWFTDVYEYHYLAITEQPQNYAGAVGDTVKFSVVAEGDGELTYQWQNSDDDGATWNDSAITSSIYTTTLTEERDGRLVRCVVSDSYGGSVTSDAAIMSISA